MDTIHDASVAEIASLGDVVIVLRNSGRSGVGFIRGHKVPLDIIVDYGGDKEDPALSIRRVTVKAGWLASAWKKADRETRDSIGNGSEEWQQLALWRNDG